MAKKRGPIDNMGCDARNEAKEDKKALEAVDKKCRQEERTARKAARDNVKAEKEAEKRRRQYVKDQKKHWKQIWEEYCTMHDVDGATINWPEDKKPKAITQTDAGKLYSLKPSELACLRHHPQVNYKFGNTTKLFDEDEVARLAFRKYAMLAGVPCGDTAEEENAMIAHGKKLWKDEGVRLGAGKGLESGDGDEKVGGNHDVNWRRDPHMLGHENGELPAAVPRVQKADSNDDSKQVRSA